MQGKITINFSVLERLFKSREIFSENKVSTDFLIIRCDGRNFRKLAKKLDLEPFDARFHNALVDSTEEFMKKSGFDVRVAYIASDEVNLLFKSLPFRGRIEKLDSIVASLLTSSMTIRLVREFNYLDPIAFDARVIALNNFEEIAHYFLWRQSDTYRNFLNKYAQLALIREGRSQKSATKLLNKIKAEELVKIIETKIQSIDLFPNWQKYGEFLFTIWVEKEAIDKISGRAIKVLRKKIRRETFNIIGSIHEFLDKVTNSLIPKPK